MSYNDLPPEIKIQIFRNVKDPETFRSLILTDPIYIQYMSSSADAYWSILENFKVVKRVKYPKTTIIETFIKFSTYNKKKKSFSTKTLLHSFRDEPALFNLNTRRNHGYELKKYYKYGKLHRSKMGPDGMTLPAVTHSGNSMTLPHEDWFQNGVQFRENDLPSYVEYYADGNNIKKEMYLKDHEYYRPGDLPSNVAYYKNHNIKKVKYMRGTILYRENLPAVISYYKDGTKKEEKFAKHGVIEVILEYNKKGDLVKKLIPDDDGFKTEDSDSEESRSEDSDSGSEMDDSDHSESSIESE